MAGPLPLVECWALSNEFEPLSGWCIAAKERCRSVYVLSRVPFSELDHVMMGVTKESLTSAALCDVLIRYKYNHQVRMRNGLEAQDAAWLVIGDQALGMTNQPLGQVWPYVTDLATEWWNWKQTPFIFARWVVRRDLSPSKKKELNDEVAQNLKKGLAALGEISSSVALRSNLSPMFVKSYLSEFIYDLPVGSVSSENEFQRLCQPGVLRELASH
ncbi:MAG: Chorismate dehydratase [Elusimicrobia bacterium]|nr:Chorismate dehydratase [Elusimicrobiota bacterium]